MKIWITRLSANQIMFGGLERLKVWWEKPIYLVEKIQEKDRDTPFGYISEEQGFYKYSNYNYEGWVCFESKGRIPFSFGKIFGYSDGENKELAEFVWNKLCEHFLNEPFDNWDKLEKEGKVYSSDFLLEIDLNITMK